MDSRAGDGGPMSSRPEPVMCKRILLNNPTNFRITDDAGNTDDGGSQPLFELAFRILSDAVYAEYLTQTRH